MSKKKLHELLKISIDSDPSQCDDDQYALTISEGIKDFLDLDAGSNESKPMRTRIKNTASNRLIKKVLLRCKKGGMSKSELSIALNSVTRVENKELKSHDDQLKESLNHYFNISSLKLIFKNKLPYSKHYRTIIDEYKNSDDKRKAWSHYYLNNNQMEIANLQCFILLAKSMKWLDYTKPPEHPHPSEYKWGSTRPTNMDSRLRRWAHFERPSDANGFIERIDVINSIYSLIKTKQQINFQSIYDYFIFESAFRKKHKLTHNKASISQTLQRFKIGNSFKSSFQENTNTNIIKILFDTNDNKLITENKDKARIKRLERDTGNQKLRPRNKINGEFTKS